MSKRPTFVYVDSPGHAEQQTQRNENEPRHSDQLARPDRPQQHPQVQHFLQAVCQPVRATKLHSDIQEELLSHIEPQVQEHIELGLSKEEAVKAALTGMGDPAHIGKGFDNAHRPRTDWALLIPLLLFAGTGTLIYYGISLGNPKYANLFTAKAIFTLAGLAIMAALWAADYERLKKYAEHSFGIGIAILALGSLSAFTTEINGQAGWFLIGGYFVIYAPSIAILPLIIGLAGARAAKVWSWRSAIGELAYRGALPLLLSLGLKAHIWAAIYAAVFMVHVWLTKRNKLQALAIISGMTVVLACVVLNSRTLLIRLTAFFQNDQQGAGYFAARSMDAMSSAGWLGQGFGASGNAMKFSYSDSVLPYFMYSFGWAAGYALILLVIVFVYKLLLSVLFIKDDFGKRMAAGITAMLAIQFIWPLLKIFGYAPFSDIDFPFLSHGGSAQFIQYAMIGLLLGIYRRRDMISAP